MLPSPGLYIALATAWLCCGHLIAHEGTHTRLEVIDEQIAEDPDDPELRLRRAEALRQSGFFEAALVDYQLAEDRGGDQGLIALGRGRSLLAAGQVEQALAELHRAVAHLGADSVALRARASAHTVLGQHGPAADDLLRAFADRERLSPEGVIELSRALSKADRVDQALATLDTAIARLGPITSLTREALGIATSHRRDAEAEARIAAWTADDPLPLRIAVLAAEALETSGRPQAIVGALPAAATTETTLTARGAVWRYLDDGSNQGAAWSDPAFPDGTWAMGPAQLGYGNNDEQTVVSFGGDPDSRHITTYFRHAFMVADASVFQRLDLALLRDDGAVVYLNGTEVMRSAMPAGVIAFNTLADSMAGGSDEDVFRPMSIDPGLLVDGANVLAVEIHQESVTSPDISFDLELVAADGPLVITRGPYLQRGSATSVTVRWRTDPASDTRVRYGTDPGTLSSMVDGPAGVIEHEVTLDSLTPDTKHFYSVGDGSGVLAGGDSDHFFVTAPEPGTAKPTRIWVLGDSGSANVFTRLVRDAYDAFTGDRETDLWLMLGDNAYDAGTDLEYQSALFDLFPRHLRTSVMWPTLGNHDGRSANSATQTGPYYDMFTLPTMGEAGGVASGTEAYYSFDYGNIHFICLESFETDRSAAGAMMTWLEDDIAATTADWVIAYWHHPPYTKGSHDSDAEVRLIEMRTIALPILDNFGVDLVLSGHSHSYERSFMLDGHYGVSSTLDPSMILDDGDGDPAGDGAYDKPTHGPAPHEGAVYVVAGSSSRLTSADLDHPAMIRAELVLGSVILDVDHLELNATFLDDQGVVADTFTILKAGGNSIFADGFESGDTSNWSLDVL